MKPGDIVRSKATGRRFRVIQSECMQLMDIEDGEVFTGTHGYYEPEDPAATRAIEEREARDERDFQAGKDDAWED